MNKIKEKIKRKIHDGISWNMSEAETNYIAGLADALEIIEEEEKERLQIGREYFVLVWNEHKLNTEIQSRVLSKITKTVSRTAYTFALPDMDDPKPVVLYKNGGLIRRVFKNYEDAEQGMKHVYLKHK